MHCVTNAPSILTIRQASARDIDAITDILTDSFCLKYRYSFGVNPSDTSEILADLYRHGLISLEETWVAESDAGVVGILILHLPGKPITPPAISLWSMLRRHLSFAQSLKAFARCAVMHFVFEGRTVKSPIPYLNTLAVQHRHRSKGIGTRLLHEAMRIADEAGCSKISLHVVDTNKGAISLYQRMGFVEQGTQRIGDRLALALSWLACGRAGFKKAHWMVKSI